MPLQVLVVEDSSGDIRLTREAFRDVNPFIHLEVAHDGVEAMAFLRQEEPFVGAPRPDLILLDLNLPKMDGRQVLALIKEDDNLKTIPTVILTSSQAEADVVKSYQLQANCYLSKPMHFEAFHELVKSINDFWLSRVQLPQKGDEIEEQEIGACATAVPDREKSRGMRGNNVFHRRKRNAH